MKWLPKILATGVWIPVKKNFYFPPPRPYRFYGPPNFVSQLIRRVTHSERRCDHSSALSSECKNAGGEFIWRLRLVLLGARIPPFILAQTSKYKAAVMYLMDSPLSLEATGPWVASACRWHWSHGSAAVPRMRDLQRRWSECFSKTRTFSSPYQFTFQQYSY